MPAGFGFLFYIAVGITQLVLSGPTRGEGTVATLALIARHAWRIRTSIVLSLVICVTAVVLATALYAITRDEDRDLAELLMQIQGWNVTVTATLFAFGSTVFSWLLLRGRMIPVALAWLGVVSSILLAIGLPLQLVDVLSGSVTQLLWIPMAAFEIPLGFWLLLRGARSTD
jgi:uncharacterized protein DUF4386